MQVLVRALSSAHEEAATVVLTNTQATIETIISSYCLQTGVPFNPKMMIFDASKRALPKYSTLNSLGVRNGQNLLIGNKNESSWKAKWPLLISLVGLVIGIIGVITLSMVYGLSGGIYPLDHGVVMDAGSSKTNVLEYSWKSDKNKGTGDVNQGATCYAKGGIAQMDPMKLDQVIECAEIVTSHIDQRIRSKTPLYFAATAGMRLLKLSDPVRARKILEHLSFHLNETELSVKAIEIISGQDEGIYAWITVNFLVKSLEIERKFNPWVPTTRGALDMGGASMQIAFALPPGHPNASRSEVKSMQLYGQNHEIFSRTNLCFGREEASRRFRALLVTNPSITTIDDPCAPSGFSEELSGDFLLNQPCTLSAKFDEWMKRDPTIRGKKFTFRGTSSYDFCIGNVSKLLDDKICSDMRFKECFKKLEDPPKDQKYLAFATYFFTTQFLKLTKSSLSEYENVTKDFCLKTFQEITNTTDNKYASQYCFNAQYIHEVLINGFGFNNETWENLEFVGELSDKEVGWTLGYMINATNIIPKKSPSEKLLSAGAVTVSLVLLILVAIASVVFIIHTRCRNKDNNTVTSNYGTP